jgi:hypothetical protein
MVFCQLRPPILEHQAGKVAPGATLHHRQAAVAVIAQVGQQRFEDGGVSVRVGGKVDAVGLDVESPAARRQCLLHPAEGGKDFVQGLLQALGCVGDNYGGHYEPPEEF